MEFKNKAKNGVKVLKRKVVDDIYDIDPISEDDEPGKYFFFFNID